MDIHDALSDHADAVTDSYQERVTRNEGRLEALETLVRETREADKKLIEQRSDSLASELERRAEALLELVTARADAVLTLGKEERESDRREVAAWVHQHQERTEELKDGIRREADLTQDLLRELYDTTIKKNHEQNVEALKALEQRRIAATDRIEQMVRQWRDSDREARELFAAETQRHLEQLNHNNERMAKFQAESVSRDVYQADKDAAIGRENVLREQIIALDRIVLTMTPTASSDKTHDAMRNEMRDMNAQTVALLSNKISVVDEKVADLKTYRDTTSGKSDGRAALYAALVAAVSLIVGVVVAANALAR